MKTLIPTFFNCAAQFRSRFQLAWMVYYAEDAESVTTVLAIYPAEYHGKGPADSAAGGAKTKLTKLPAKEPQSKQLKTCTFSKCTLQAGALSNFTSIQLMSLRQTMHKATFHPFTKVTEAHHEALHEIHCRQFHYFRKGTFATYSPLKLFLWCKTFCPCANYISGEC